MSTATLRRALLISSDDEPLTDVETDLRAGGFDVVRCHPEGAPKFPCAALTDAGCPLAEAIDVTVDVRQHPWPSPTQREQGVTCSVRAGVPVVIVGHPRHPFTRWATVSTESHAQLARQCDEAIRLGLAPLEAAAARAVRAVLARHAEPPPFIVEIERVQGRLHVRIVAQLTKADAGMAATRAVAAIRPLDTAAISIEVDVVPPLAR